MAGGKDMRQIGGRVRTGVREFWGKRGPLAGQPWGGGAWLGFGSVK